MKGGEGHRRDRSRTAPCPSDVILIFDMTEVRDAAMQANLSHDKRRKKNSLED
jgi:hypothetical protein